MSLSTHSDSVGGKEGSDDVDDRERWIVVMPMIAVVVLAGNERITRVMI